MQETTTSNRQLQNFIVNVMIIAKRLKVLDKVSYQNSSKIITFWQDMDCVDRDKVLYKLEELKTNTLEHYYKNDDAFTKKHVYREVDTRPLIE